MTLLLLLLMAEPTKVVYAAGYIPNIQFAPFYVADSRGYYREEGIELVMDYTMGPDVMKLAALNKVNIASADPDGFLHAVNRGLPLIHVATLYQRYPLALIAKQPILTAEGLKGKRIGISGAYGSSYLGLKAMLSEMGLKLGDIQLATIGFTQVAALRKNQVDAVVGYLNNEPVLLGAEDGKIYTRTLGAGYDFPGVGLMTNQTFLKNYPELVEGFLRATFRGMADVLADPRECFELVVAEELPELKGSANYEVSYRILQATLPFWQSEETNRRGFGQCAEELWEQLAEKLQETTGNKGYASWEKWVRRDYRFELNSQ